MVYATDVLEICNDFWVVLQNISKFPKHILTNNFVGSLNTYSKGHNQIQAMQNPFKVIIFGCFEGEKTVEAVYIIQIYINS